MERRRDYLANRPKGNAPNGVGLKSAYAGPIVETFRSCPRARRRSRDASQGQAGASAQRRAGDVYPSDEGFEG